MSMSIAPEIMETGKILACIDLFCGAGGLTHGLTLAGVPVVAGIDIDPACRHPFETNNGARFIREDVSRTNPATLKSLFGDVNIRVLAGCAPYPQYHGTANSSPGPLLYEFSRLVEGVLPDIVIMEDAPAINKHVAYGDFITTLERLNYKVWNNIVDCSKYGLPQRRRQTVLLASRLGPIALIEPTHDRPVTVREAIGKLPVIAAGESFHEDPLHTSPKLSELNLARIQASRPGGTWRDWPEGLIAECRRRGTGRAYSGTYGRMVWDEPAPTLSTQFFGFGNGRFGHPEQDRAISLREGAILQGFPNDYSFVHAGAPVRFKTLGRLIGSAAPVTLGKAIGRSILQHFLR